MRRIVLAALAVLAVSLPAVAAVAADYRVGGVEIRHPWSRPAAAGLNGVGYLTLVNVGPKPIKLIAVESPAARSVTVHKTSMDGAVMTMAPVTDGLSLAPGASAVFAPGGYHLMLMGLTKAQTLGGKIPLTLIFEGGRRIAIELTVETGTAPAMGGMDHHPG